jgi:hypothetical protein
MLFIMALVLPSITKTALESLIIAYTRFVFGLTATRDGRPHALISPTKLFAVFVLR